MRVLGADERLIGLMLLTPSSTPRLAGLRSSGRWGRVSSGGSLPARALAIVATAVYPG
jgi:hypothetical protein